VASRRPQAAAAVAALAGSVGHVADPEEASRADLVIQATPVGMEGGPNPGATVIDPGLLGPGQWLVDLVYHPIITPLAEAAARRGATVIEGTWMLLYQAARSFELWTGLEPPLQAMRSSLLSALSTSGTGKKRP
jgi:shikimate dehydrogenase